MTLLKKFAAVGLGLSLLGAALSTFGWLLGGGLYHKGSAWHIGGAAAYDLRETEKEQAASGDPETLQTALAPFHKVEAEIGAARFVLEAGDGFSIGTAGIEDRYFSQEIHDGELKVRYWPRKYSEEIPEAQIIITVPAGTELEEVSLEGGVSRGEIRGISCHELDISSGVGAVELFDVAAGSLEIEGGIGETLGTNLSVQRELSLEGGLGNVSLQGDMRGQLDLEVGVGEIQLEFTGAAEEYALSLPRRGLGSMTVNGKEYSDAASPFSAYPTANQITLESGVGSVHLRFGQDGPKAERSTDGDFAKTSSILLRSGEEGASPVHITQPEQVSQVVAALSDPSRWEVDELPRHGVTQVCTIEFYQTPTPTVLEGASSQEELLLTASLYIEPDEDGEREDDEWYLSFSGIMSGTFEIPRETGEYLREVQQQAR